MQLRHQLVVLALAARPTAQEIAPPKLEPDDQNVVANLLPGRWEPDPALCERLGVRHDARLALTVEPDDDVVGTVPPKFHRALARTRVYLAGTLTMGRGDTPRRHAFLLVGLNGNMQVVYFRPRDGDPMGDAESMIVTAVRANTRQQDVLFVGGDFDNQPSTPMRRVADPSAAPDTPAAVVEAWIRAAKARDKQAMLALGTSDWVERETTWERSFTSAIFLNGLTLKSCELRPTEIDGDTARVSCRAVFTDAKGEEDGEGLRFRLRRVEGVWKIVELG